MRHEALAHDRLDLDHRRDLLAGQRVVAVDRNRERATQRGDGEEREGREPARHGEERPAARGAHAEHQRRDARQREQRGGDARIERHPPPPSPSLDCAHLIGVTQEELE